MLVSKVKCCNVEIKRKLFWLKRTLKRTYSLKYASEVGHDPGAGQCYVVWASKTSHYNTNLIEKLHGMRFRFS